MNTEKFQAKSRLLNDVLSEELERSGGGGKHIAIAAFRRARLQRRARAYLGVAVIVTAALAVLFHSLRVERRVGIAVKTSEPQPRTTPVEIDGSLPKLTDEELIASFPSNTCFLAEVDGRKVLVFTDRSLREKFVHYPAGLSSQARF